ncbi:MAG TPA: SURF1 family protein [Ideonella sp.]|nr:SURF1 family protein [Ideonella sp.]
MSPAARRIVILLAALTGMAVTARMGAWQLDRAAQKLALQAALASQAAAPPLPAEQLAGNAAQALGQHYRRITLRGEWLPAHTVYLDNRQMGGRPGFFVLTPLRLASPPGRAVVVQRGWIPRDMQDRTRLPPIVTPSGEVSVSGRVAPPPSRLADLGPDAPGTIRQNVDLDSLATEAGLSLLPLSIIELPSPGQTADGLQRDWPQPAVDVQKNYGYAAQWFIFCALIAGLYVWFQLIRPRRRPRG